MLTPAPGTQDAKLTTPTAAGYDEEARYFEARVSQAKADELQEALDGLVKPAFELQLAILRELTLTVFKQQLEVDVLGESFVERAER